MSFLFGTQQGIKEITTKLEEKNMSQYMVSEEGKRQYIIRKRREKEKNRDRTFKKMLKIANYKLSPKNAFDAQRRVASMFENQAEI